MPPEDAVDVAAANVPAGFAVPDVSMPAARPGVWRRFAAGAWHVPGGVAFLLKHPRLWGLALIPSILGVAGLVAGLTLGIYGVRTVETTIGPHRPQLPDLLDLVGDLGLWMGTLSAGVLGALALVLFVSAPILEWLERRVERMAGGAASGAAPRKADALRAWRHSAYLIALAPFAFVISLMPFVGPPAAGVLVALALPFQLTAPALARRGLDGARMRRWHGDWRAEMFGFGVAALLLMPLLFPILAPVLVTGAARLVLETSGDAPVPPPGE